MRINAALWLVESGPQNISEFGSKDKFHILFICFVNSVTARIRTARTRTARKYTRPCLGVLTKCGAVRICGPTKAALWLVESGPQIVAVVSACCSFTAGCQNFWTAYWKRQVYSTPWVYGGSIAGRLIVAGLQLRGVCIQRMYCGPVAYSVRAHCL